MTVFLGLNSCATPFSGGRFVGLLHTIRVRVDAVHGFVGWRCTINVLGVRIGGVLAGYECDGTHGKGTGVRDPREGFQKR